MDACCDLGRRVSRSIYARAMASTELSRRVGSVVGYPPLCDIGEFQRREFHQALSDVETFEDLRGKWTNLVTLPPPIGTRERTRNSGGSRGDGQQKGGAMSAVSVRLAVPAGPLDPAPLRVVVCRVANADVEAAVARPDGDRPAQRQSAS